MVFDQLETLALELAAQERFSQVGIVVEGAPAAYALVWEYGNLRQTQQGPKTVEGVNPNGEIVWLSAQAPSGYIQVNSPKYWQIVETELSKVRFMADRPTRRTRKQRSVYLMEQIDKAGKRAAKGILNLIRETVPVDTGALRDAIRVAENDELTSITSEDVDVLLALEMPGV